MEITGATALSDRTRHEAAHALYGWAAGFPVHRIAIHPHEQCYTELTLPCAAWQLARQWRTRRDPRADVQQIIGVVMAGKLAAPGSIDTGDQVALGQWREAWQRLPGRPCSWWQLHAGALSDVQAWLKAYGAAVQALGQHLVRRLTMDNASFSAYAVQHVGPRGYWLRTQSAGLALPCIPRGADWRTSGLPGLDL